MTQIFLNQEIDYSNPIIFTVPDSYSMAVAVQILKQLEEADCDIQDHTWKSSGYGKLIEQGILVRLETIEIEIMCSYEDIFIKRLSGNKRKFYNFCESIRVMDFYMS